jgi:subtilisin-like proprotein convertase family protein
MWSEGRSRLLSTLLILVVSAFGALPLAVASPTARTPVLAAESDFSLRTDGRTSWLDRQVEYQATNPSQGLRIYFANEGVVLLPPASDPADWSEALELTEFGYSGDLHPVHDLSLAVLGNRAQYGFSDGVSGWVSNDAEGIGHGFLVKAAPDGRLPASGSTVELSLATRGHLYAKVSDPTSVVFTTDDGSTAFRYTVLSVTGAGREIPFHIEQSLDGQSLPIGFRLVLEAAADSYPVKVSAFLSNGASPAETTRATATVDPILGQPGMPELPLSPTATTLLSPTGDGGFETGASFPANGWTLVNDASHIWRVGAVAVPFAGARSAFISNDGGVSYAYTNTVAQTSHFYRDLTVPAGESVINLSFQIKVTGESGWDRLLVYTAPTSVTPVAGTPAANSTTLTGATLVYTGVPLSGSAYTAQSVVLSPALAGTTFRLIFTWQNDDTLGTNPPASLDNISVISDTPPPPPANDLCSGAIALTLNIPRDGTNTFANNDYSITAPAVACFPGVGQTTTSVPGRDTVYSFTAPAAGLYSFRANLSATGGNLATYLTLPAGPAYACPATGAQTCDATLVAANRNGGTAQWATEEVMCQSLAAGQKVYWFIDEVTLSTTGGGHRVVVESCTRETEGNNDTATANPLLGVCPIEGTISPAAEADFYLLPPTSPGSRVFAMADGAAGSSTDFDLRVTDAANTLEYDDLNLDTPFGPVAPTADGTKATGVATYLRVNHFSASTISEPYRLYAVARGDSAGAAPESEANDTLATANSIASGYVLAAVGSTADVDYYSVPAVAGDLIFVGLDTDPDYLGLNALDARMSLRDSTDAVLVAAADSSTALGNRCVTSAGFTATTPIANGEALVWRVPTAGTYYVRVELQTGSITTPKPYLLSITKNCTLPGCQTDPDCDDGNVCTDDSCAAGVCLHVDNTDPCASDNNLCTDDVCSGGLCTHPANSLPCNDANGCTSADTCSGGNCVGTPNSDPCEDNNACTSGTTCINGACGTPNSDPCSDGNACTLNDTCASGACVPGNYTTVAPVSYCNNDGIDILDTANEPLTDAADPYPSSVTVSGALPVVCKVTVNLNQISHSFPDDIDILLTAPGTASNALIMSDAGGGTDLVDVDVLLDDAAATALPDAATITSGSWRPANYEVNDLFPAGPPASSPDENAALSVFNGSDPNGAWNLYVVDDLDDDLGDIASWCVNLATVCAVDADCDDGNACTVDTCFKGGCLHSSNPLGEVTGVGAPDRTTLTWSPLAGAAVYDVARGEAQELPVGPGAGETTEICYQPSIAGTSATDGSDPAPGVARYYLVRGRVGNCPGTWGYATGGAERIVTASCP